MSNVPDVDITFTGFDEAEVKQLLRSLDVRENRERPEHFDLDAALEQATRKPRAKPGDRWHLGDHVLVCGDWPGSAPDMAFTDPPYNVAYGDHGGQQRGAKRRRIGLTTRCRPPSGRRSAVAGRASS